MNGDAGPLRILYTAYPLIPVGPDSAGGAEQMLSALEDRMAARGHQTTVAACSGSSVAGDLLCTDGDGVSQGRFESMSHESSRRIITAIRARQHTSHAFHLIHDTGGCLRSSAAEIDTPLLVTIHLPRYFYARGTFRDLPENLFFNCVSQAQRAWFGDISRVIAVVPNGIALERFSFQAQKSDYLLWLGRICPEKGPHLALDAAERAGLPVVIAGQVYPFPSHQRYFRRWILPRLEKRRCPARLLLRPTLEEKLELLKNARAVLVPSLVDETSSLVSMEAMASGTPVIAYARGALPEVVADGQTGILVRGLREMAEATRRVHRISPFDCRQRAEEHFSASRMAGDYERLYRQVAGYQVDRGAAAD